MPSDMNQTTAEGAHCPKEGHARSTKEAKHCVSKLPKQPAVNRKLNQLLLIQRACEKRIDPMIVVEREGEVLDNEITNVVIGEVHSKVDDDVGYEEKHDNVDRVKGWWKWQVPNPRSLVKGVFLLLFLLLVFLGSILIDLVKPSDLVVLR